MNEVARRYKDLISIRRDLRGVYNILNHALILAGDLSASGEEHFNARAMVLYAIVSYAGWFKSTKGRIKLKGSDFFTANSNESKTHERSLEIRDKYVAHPELDILGGDSVLVVFDTAGAFIKFESTWLIQMYPDLGFGSVL